MDLLSLPDVPPTPKDRLDGQDRHAPAQDMPTIVPDLCEDQVSLNTCQLHDTTLKPQESFLLFIGEPFQGRKALAGLLAALPYLYGV